MTTQRIIASSGGFVSTPGLWGVMRPGGIFLEALRLSGKERPRVCLVMTASGGFVEVQGTAEGAPFSRAEMDALLALADKGIRELNALQRQALGVA